jgi:hypothetical protein
MESGIGTPEYTDRYILCYRRVFSQRFLASYWSAEFETFLQVRTLLPIGWRVVQILRQRRRKTTNTAPTTRSAIRTASQPNFINAQL